jgi:multidrug efflux pump
VTLSDLSVRRPVFAAVAAIILVVVGVAAFTSLSVRELPSVDPPQVSVSTSYTGASAEVIEERITQVIERQVAGIQGIDRVTSTSRDGRSQVSIAFKPGRPLDDAANDVRDAVSRVAARLPDQADPPQVNKADADAQPIMIVVFNSTTMNRLELTDYANRFLVERISTVPGVAQVNIGGSQNFAMRIWLDPGAMAARGLTVDDVENALNAQNVELPAGSLESSSKDFTVRVARQYARAEDFAQMPISAPSGSTGAGALTTSATGANTGAAAARSTAGATGAYLTRLGDIARIEEGPDERRRLFRSNGRDQLGITITRQSDANDLEISKAVKQAVADINPTLPKGSKLEVAVDYSVFTSEAIHEVWLTMGISLALVALVNMVFLGSWRSALVPTIVAPICIVATFIVLAALGFSINLLTLLALVLAIGLVVDDAIVVVENIQRRIDEGEPPLVAAERGARQVFFAIIAVTAVLLTVFAPLMFMPGYIGSLFVELAVAVAAAVFFSALLALSLSPMLASKLLRPASGEGRMARIVDHAIDKLRTSYARSLQMILTRRAAAALAGIVVLALAGAAGGLFVVLPKELVPAEDRGRVDISITGPEGAGYDYTLAMTKKVEPYLQKLVDEKIASLYVLTAPGFGGGTFNSGSGNVSLVPWKERSVSADDVAARLNRELGAITGAQITASVRPALQVRGGGGGNSIQLIAKGDDYAELNTWIQPILAAARENPGFSRAEVDYDPSSPRLVVNMDREKAASLGVQPRAIGRVLETMLGSRRVTTYIKGGQEYDVILQAEMSQRRSQSDLSSFYLRSTQGGLVPLTNLVTTEVRGDTPDRRRVDRQRAVSLRASLAPGYTTAEAITFLQKEAAKQPVGATITWGGAAKDYLEGAGGVGFAFGMALLLVFLVLAAQFESWIHPAVIMITVPLAALGGLFALLMWGSTLNLYSEIGLIILIGIAAKNGILIVEFANQLRDEGRSVTEAIIEASAVRLRPILMTSIAAAFGALPLIFAHGPGAASRETIGVVIFAGALFATLLTLFVVPVFYNLLARFTKSPEWTAREIERFEKEVPDVLGSHH